MGRSSAIWSDGSPAPCYRIGALDTYRAWLAGHQSIAIVARDRSGGFGEAVAKALPDAEQVADGWHLMENSSRAFLDAVGKARGAWLLFLPAYSPGLNPIEMAFSKLKTPLRKRAVRSFDAVAEALGDICDLVTVTECRNFFKAAG